MGTLTVEKFLEHWGVKGMHWGVRNERRKAAKAEKKAAKADTKWQKNIYSMKGAIDVHNHVAHTMNNGEIDALNNTPRFKKAFDEAERGGKPVFDSNLNPVGKLGQDYMNDYHNRVEKATAKAVREVHGTSPSGRHRAIYKNDRAGGGPRVEIVHLHSDDAKHSVDGVDALKPNSQTLSKQPTLKILVDQDPKTGAIGTHAKIKEDEAEQSDPAGEFLSHWGIKGMKWGVRNIPGPDGTVGGSGKGKIAKAPSKTKRTKKSKSSGSTRPPAHTLSDEELKQQVARMELEKKYSDLASGKHSKTKGAGASFAGELGKNLVRTAVTAAGTHAVNQALKTVTKK